MRRKPSRRVRLRTSYPMKMAAAPASERLEFGPRRAPIWMARIFGAIACAGSLLVLVAAGITLRTTGQAQAIFGVLGLFCAIWIAFGVWMLITASRMSRFRAIVTPGALRLVAAKGRSVWFQGIQPGRHPESGCTGRGAIHLYSFHQGRRFQPQQHSVGKPGWVDRGDCAPQRPLRR
jgi:hypothetical protein